MTRVILAMLVALWPAASLHGQAPAPAPVPVLVELFTSEGCNSCPPADRLLEMLSREQPIPGAYVVVLSEHVTYWDRLGWKDPFGSQRFTARQNMYAFRFNLDGPYTPQVVVDGSAQMIGSDAAQVRHAIAEAARLPKPALTIEAVADARGGLTASASGPALRLAEGENAELLWVIAEDALSSDVKRGENANRTLHHWGVVRTMIARRIEPAGVNGMREELPLRPEWQARHLRLVAFVQAAKSKRVLSVATATIRSGQ